jgi:hypothetical protein
VIAKKFLPALKHAEIRAVAKQEGNHFGFFSISLYSNFHPKHKHTKKFAQNLPLKYQKQG